MANAKEPLLSFLSAGPEQAGALFKEDGALEIPYLASVGLATRYSGRRDVVGFLHLLHEKVYPGAVFENGSIHIETPNQVLGEYHLTAKSGISGNTVHQQFLGHLVVENGKIKLLRESIDTVAAANAMFLSGLADLLQGKANWPPS